MNRYDVVFLGSSPNALAGAARLARAGLRVLVLDERAEVGGPVATEELVPGFRADTGVMSAALDPEIVAELGISVEVIRRGSVTSLGPAPLTLRAPPPLPRAVAGAVDLLRAMYRMAPPSMPVPADGDSAALGELGSRFGGLGRREKHEVLRLLFMSARDFFGETAADERERALLCGAAVRAMSEGPFAQGTLFGYLHHEAMGDGLFRDTARGGVGSLARALAERAAALGAEIRTGVTALAVDVADGVARGARLPGGERIAADAVVSDRDVRATFTRLVPPYELDPEANRAVRAVRCRGSVARVNLALSALPVFNQVDPEALKGTLVLAPDVASLERAWDQAKRGVVPERPYLEVTLPTVTDPALAPEGRHVLSAWVQYVPYGRADREELSRAVIGALAAFAPGLPGLVLSGHVAPPEDLECRFGLTEGHLYGGEVNLSQAFFLRGFPGYGRHETPIEGLYLCGSATHPGGFSGRSGWSLAGRLLGGSGRERAGTG